jgi:hypothetical protein
MQETLVGSPRVATLYATVIAYNSANLMPVALMPSPRLKYEFHWNPDWQQTVQTNIRNDFDNCEIFLWIERKHR